MSLSSIQAAIDARLATLGFDMARIAFLNVTFAPTSGVSYLRASMPVLRRKALTVGAEAAAGGAGITYQWTGAYQVDAVWPADAGADGAAQMVDKILRLFPHGLTISTTDGLQISFNDGTPVPVRQDGAWFRGAASCPWWCFEHS